MERIHTIARKINSLSTKFKIGDLQDIRKVIKNLTRRAGSHIFQNSTISEKGWAFHYGGRKELQFNIGFEDEGFRYGVAFSLETSRDLPDISVLFPKIRKFNEFVRENADFFKGYKMWSWHGKRSKIGPVVEIKPELIQPKTFIFMGKISSEGPRYKNILKTFDELLKVYLFVESGKRIEVENIDDESAGFKFERKAKRLTFKKKYTSVERNTDLDIRHSLIQEKLQKKLENTYGESNVSVENACYGKKIDLVVRVGNKFRFYEIKTASSAKASIREAIGQLMEYAYWPGTTNAHRIVVVGEHELDVKARDYLTFLNKTFQLPIKYLRVKL